MNNDLDANAAGPLENGDTPAHQGWFDTTGPPDPNLNVELLLLERCIKDIHGPWQVRGALIREPGESPRWVPDWVDDRYEAAPDVLWGYFVENNGGNGISNEVGFLRIGAAEDAPKVAAHFDALFRREGIYGPKAPKPVIGPVEEEPTEPATELDDDLRDSHEDHVHVEMPFAAADPLTWRLAAELVRRHPEELWILRTFPMDGHYDCLSLRNLPDVLTSPSIQINRMGTHVSVGWLGRPDEEHQETHLWSWGNAFATDDPRDWIREVERVAGLNPPTHGLPPSTRSSLVLRWIAAFLAMQIGSRPRWSAWNDWAGVDEGRHPASFDAIPQAAEWLRDRGHKEAAAFVWFVGTVETAQTQPKLALSVEGHLWRDGRDVIDLATAYRSAGSSMASLVVSTAGDLIP